MNAIGLATHHSRVERWECDYNNHWNVRYYGRSFQLAAESIAAATRQANPGAAVIRSRHMRFHRELFVSAPVEVRSATLQSGPHAGAIVHLLTSGDAIAATALDFPGHAAHLPAVLPVDVPMALPRGLGTEPMGDWPLGPGVEVRAELGPIRPGDIDHTGELLFDQIIRHSSVMSHVQLNLIGLTPEYSDRTGINRMGVEFLVSRNSTPTVGSLLHGRCKLTRVDGKRFWVIHRVLGPDEETVATVEQCIVTVDLNTRRAVDVPDFIHTAMM